MYRTRTCPVIATAATMSVAIGCTVNWHAGNGLNFSCTIMDVRQRFGATDYLIRPVAGDGMRWVSADACRA